MATDGNGWERRQMTVRLTAKRKELLRRLALRVPAAQTPQQAWDRALESALVAIDGEADFAERLAQIEETLARMDEASASQVARLEAAAVQVSQSVDALRTLLASVAAQD